MWLTPASRPANSTFHSLWRERTSLRYVPFLTDFSVYSPSAPEPMPFLPFLPQVSSPFLTPNPRKLPQVSPLAASPRFCGLPGARAPPSWLLHPQGLGASCQPPLPPFLPSPFSLVSSDWPVARGRWPQHGQWPLCLQHVQQSLQHHPGRHHHSGKQVPPPPQVQPLTGSPVSGGWSSSHSPRPAGQRGGRFTPVAVSPGNEV